MTISDRLKVHTIDVAYTLVNLADIAYVAPGKRATFSLKRKALDVPGDGLLWVTNRFFSIPGYLVLLLISFVCSFGTLWWLDGDWLRVPVQGSAESNLGSWLNGNLGELLSVKDDGVSVEKNSNNAIGDAGEIKYHASKIFDGINARIDTSDKSSISGIVNEIQQSRSQLPYAEYCYLRGRSALIAGQKSVATDFFARVVDVDDEFVAEHPEAYYFLATAVAQDQVRMNEYLRQFLSRAADNSPWRAAARQALEAEVAIVKREPASRISSSERPPRVPVAESATSISAGNNRDKDSLLLNTPGGQVLLDEIDGRFLLLNFWASWCVPCATELPAFLEFVASDSFKKQKGIVAVLVSVDNYRGEADNFLKLKKLKVPLFYHDPGMIVLQAAAGNQSLPRTVLYDTKNRRVVKVFPEGVEWSSRDVRRDVFQSAKSTH